MVANESTSKYKHFDIKIIEIGSLVYELSSLEVCAHFQNFSSPLVILGARVTSHGQCCYGNSVPIV